MLIFEGLSFAEMRGFFYLKILFALSLEFSISANVVNNTASIIMVRGIDIITPTTVAPAIVVMANSINVINNVTLMYLVMSFREAVKLSPIVLRESKSNIKGTKENKNEIIIPGIMQKMVPRKVRKPTNIPALNNSTNVSLARKASL